MLRLRAIALLVLCLCVVGPCFADTLQVSFIANINTGLPDPNRMEWIEHVEGSFLWDTALHTFSNIAIQSSGPFTYLPEISTDMFLQPRFVQPGDLSGRMAGSILWLSFPDVTGTGSFNFDYLQHAGFDTPVEPVPGTYFGEFDLTPAGYAPMVLTEGTNEVVVTATPEPGSFYLLGFGSFAMLSVLASKKLIRAH